MFYKIELYLDVTGEEAGDGLASDICCDVSCTGDVRDHIAISGPCAAEEALGAGLNLATVGPVSLKNRGPK